MSGLPNTWSYIRSFKWPPGMGNEFAPFASAESFVVRRSQVVRPRGFGFDGAIKGLYGKKRFSP